MEELARFRQEWLDELQGRRAKLHNVSPDPPTSLTIYRQAVEHEQRGQLDDALVLYRQAFRMDAHVDRAYHREERLLSIGSAQQGPQSKGRAPVDSLTIELQQSLRLKSSLHHSTAPTGILSKLTAGFPPSVTFEPEVEQEPVHLRKVPDELLIMILYKLDPTTIERFAMVNRKCRLLTLDSSIWRGLVVAIYKPPQVPNLENMVPVIERCFSDYRRVFIEHPRVRLDGVYIATCHYMRAGISENAWVNVNHLITYHRYLRFFPNGQVLSLLANEEYTPQQVITILKPSLRMKGFFMGDWQLSGTTIQLTNLIDASGQYHLSTEVPSHHPTDISERTRYTFTMSLELLSRPLGRWNKLHIQSYNSVNFETGDVCPIFLKHERPFWFSKVRSYALY